MKLKFNLNLEPVGFDDEGRPVVYMEDVENALEDDIAPVLSHHINYTLDETLQQLAKLYEESSDSTEFLIETQKLIDAYKVETPLLH